MTDQNDWKWKESSRNAFKLIGEFFNVNAEEVLNVDDDKARKILQQSDASDIQVKRVQDTTRAIRKTWKNQLRIGASLHGLVREGLNLITQQRRQEATTTKVYAKTVTDGRVLSAKTQTDVEKTYLKGAKQIEKSGKDLQRYQGDLNEQYAVIDQTANEQSQQRRISYRERTQRRLQANSRPWRNY